MTSCLMNHSQAFASASNGERAFDALVVAAIQQARPDTPPPLTPVNPESVLSRT